VNQAHFGRQQGRLPQNPRITFNDIWRFSASETEATMSNVYIEQRGEGTYRATQNGEVIATGDTQEEAIDRARRNRKKPDDPILVERVRNTEVGGRDKWRRVY
jgi:hypothetical protein